MEEIDFNSLNLKFSNLIKTYPIETQREIYEYLKNLDDINKQAYNIAYEHLGTSFNIARSNGFKLWKEVLKFINQLSEDDKLKYNYKNDYVFDVESISESKEFKDWKKKPK